MRRHGLGAAGGVPALGAAEVGHVVVGRRHAAAALVARLAHRVVDGLTDIVYLQFTNEKLEEQMFLTISSKFWAAKDDCFSKFLSFKEYFAVAIFMCLSSGFGI